MDRLTTDNPETNLQTALNLFYVKDGMAWVRGGGPEPDYKDCTLYDYIWATMKGVLEPGQPITRLPDEEIGELMADWLMDGHCCIPGLIAHLYTAAWAFVEIREKLKAYEELDMTPEDIEQTMLNFSSFLMEMTGGRMSKTNYTVQAMVAEANDYQQKELEEAEQNGYDLGVDSVLRNHFDIPWDEAADLRKNINHLRELMAAEKEGRLTPEIANETKMMFATEEENHHDKETFVRNLGWLLSQTREQVERCYLDEEEQVHVVFRGGSERMVNVKHDSYAAIIRDVSKAL